MKIVKTPQALTDLIEIADFIARDDLDVAERFFDSFDETIEILAQTPEIGSRKEMTGYNNLRMWFVKGFEKCLIFYTESADELVIVRIVHSSRDYNRIFEDE